MNDFFINHIDQIKSKHAPELSEILNEMTELKDFEQLFSGTENFNKWIIYIPNSK